MIEKLRRETGKPIGCVYHSLRINRLSYYRQVFGYRTTMRKNNRYSASVSPILCEVAEANPSLGYRRVWAKAKARGYNKSEATAYLEMKKGELLVPRPSYRDLKAAFEARKAYLVKAEGINERYQADFTQVDIPGYPVHYLLLVID